MNEKNQSFTSFTSPDAQSSSMQAGLVALCDIIKCLTPHGGNSTPWT